MKSLIRNTVFYSVALFILPYTPSGLSIKGGLPTALFGGLTMALLITFLRPILNIITFPLTVLSLGFFSFLVNVFLVYLLTVFIPNITVHEFVFAGLSFAGFVVPKIFVNTFFAYLLATLGMYGIVSFLSWITR